MRGLDGELEPRRVLAQRLLHHFLRGDVTEAPHPADECRAGTLRARVALEHAAVLGSDVVEAFVLRLPRQLADDAQHLTGLVDLVEDVRADIVGAQRHLRRDLPQPEEPLVVRHDVAVGVDYEQTVGGRLERRGEQRYGATELFWRIAQISCRVDERWALRLRASLTTRDLFPGAEAMGEVDRGSDAAGHVAIPVSQRLDLHVVRTVLKAVLEGRACAVQGRQVVLDRRIGGIARTDQIVDGRAEDASGIQLADAHQTSLDVGQAQVAIHSPDNAGYVLQNQAEILVARALLLRPGSIRRHSDLSTT